MAYANASIHYMSGTGNTRRVALWLSEELAARGTVVEMHQMGGHKPSEVAIGRGNLLAVSTPTHGFTAPLTVLRFVLNLPFARGTSAAVFATRGGTKFGSLFLPGLEGTAVYLPVLLMFLKGYRVRMARAFDMPANWLAVHPGFSRDNAEAIVSRAEERARKLFATVANGGKGFHGLIPLLFGILFFPISLAYLFVGRFFLAKLFFANDQCTACGMCASKCPNNGILMLRLIKLRPFWTFSCESCMRCMSVCPVHAIEVGQSFGLLIWFALTIPMAGLILVFAANVIPSALLLKDTLAASVIDYFYMLTVIFVLYRMMWFLSQFRFVNILLSYTTLTHFWRRYLEPRTPIGELKGNPKEDGSPEGEE